MKKRQRDAAADLRGASRLAGEATRGVTGVVEAMHRSIAAGPPVVGRLLEGPTARVTGLVYASIRGVTDLVGEALDLGLTALAPVLGEGAVGAERDVALAVLNGVIGDHLSATRNPLAIEMRLCHGARPLPLDRQGLRAALPGATGKLLVLLHGACMSDRQFCRRGHDHGVALARDLGYTPVYLHYNSGLHISTNGRAFATLLEQLVGAWPVPLAELSILGHSMGGLVARSACHAAEAAAHAWRPQLRRLVCLGSPHHGAPLERGGNWLEALLGVSRYSAPLATLGRIRSAGVTDLRYGNVLDEHWDGRDRFELRGDPRRELALPAGVACFFLAASLSAAPGGRLLGDGLVPVDSALGTHADCRLALAAPEQHRWIGYGMGHFDLLDHRDVYETLRGWLSPPAVELTRA